MGSFWKRGLEIGITGDTEERDARCLRVINALAWSAATVSSGWGLLGSLNGDLGLAGISFLQAGLFLSSLLFSRRGRLASAATVLVVVLVATILVEYWFWGPATQLHYYLLVAAVLPFLALPQRMGRLALLLASLAGLAFVGAEVLQDRLEPIRDLGFPFPLAAGINALAATVVLGLTTYYARGQIFRSEATAHRERARAETLLTNALPVSIAARLKNDEPRIVADAHHHVTVLFADLVGFTAFAQELSAAELVSVLNDVFTEFDGLVEQRGVEKIKTIGDAYMAAAGVPDGDRDHATSIANLALDMRAALSRINERRGIALDLRIGIHSGPVVAGVIGRKRFAYDLWGHTVNVASRMEAHGEAGAIQISAATRALLPDVFDIEPRGTIETKGTGTVSTFWLRAGPTPA